MKTNLLVGVAMLSALSSCSQKKQQPNIVMIVVDDLNDWIGPFGGNPQVITPNLDKFAEKSMVFRNTSCAATVCGPSRSALLSGFMPGTTGLYGNGHNMMNSEIVQTHATLPEYFSKNGYLTISSGKIFHKHPTENGEDHGHWAFDIWEKETGNDRPQPDKYYSRYKGIINGEKIENALYAGGGGSDFAFGPTIVGKEETKDYRTAKWFEGKLSEKYDKPFFMSVGISKPHLAFTVPEEYFDMYNLDSIIIPEYRMDDLDDIIGKDGKKAFGPSGDFLWVKHYGIEKEAVRAYLAAVTYADECIGVVLDALAKSKYADNTIVMIYGDHGWHLGEKLRYRKATLWRESTQLPFIMHVPGMKKKQECTRNVNMIDFYPTLIDLCGLPKKELDGKSFAPLLKDPTLKWTPTVTTQDRNNHSVISEKWHYISIPKLETEELYDLENDPMEWNNLANNKTPEIEAVIKEMQTYLPRVNAPEGVSKTRPKKPDGTNFPEKDPDPTFKPKRILSQLK